MDVTLGTPALLFPAIAILMLGYINRYVGAAGVIRGFKKDYDSGYKHTEVVLQLRILKHRIELFRYMLSMGAMALVFACLSMFLIFEHYNRAGNVSFGLSLVAMIISILFSLRETFLSNKSLIIEIDDIFEREAKKKD